MSQFNLLQSKKFLPLFITQFLGAFNDNVFKNALIILLAFNTSLLPQGLSSEMAVNISAALFILPFLLFSALAGQIADFYEKSRSIRILKVAELIITTVACLSLYYQNIYLMWAALFGLGIQAAFFGPLKYSILPQHLLPAQLVGGNALIESGTFLAILTGTILGGILAGSHFLAVLLIAGAVAGLIASFKIPEAPSFQNENIKKNINFNIFSQSLAILKIAKSQKSVFLSILGISWFWFLGAVFLSQFPLLVKNILYAEPKVVTLLLTLFSVGIALGSLLCEKLSRGRLEIALVPVGALGLSIFGLDLYFALEAFIHPQTILSIWQFIEAKGSYRIMLDLFLMSIFGGLFTVPLYAFIQERAEPATRSRIIAANNILNSLFMIASAVFAVALFSLGMTITQLILATIILNTLVATYIFTVVPEFMVRLKSWIAFKS